MALTKEEKKSYLKDLEDRILEHRYYYYELHDNVISDYEYDMLEKTCKELRIELGLPWQAQEGEYHSALDMVDWDIKRPGAQEAMDRVKNGTDYHSLWVKSMMPIWERIGPGKYMHNYYIWGKEKGY